MVISHFLLLRILQVEKASNSSVGNRSPAQYQLRGRDPPGMAWSCSAVVLVKLSQHQVSSSYSRDSRWLEEVLDQAHSEEDKENLLIVLEYTLPRS